MASSPVDRAAKRLSLTLLALCTTAALALWFSATAVLPALRLEYEIGPTLASLYTSAVQAGFVVGTLASAVLGLADRLDPRRFFMVSALIGAIANAAILWLEPASPAVILCRAVTGAVMAGVYPVGMKMATTWADGDLGLLIGLIVGALTLGSGAPHLLNAFGGVDWRFTIAAASALAVLAALVINFAPLGPRTAKAPPFDPHAALRAWRHPPLRLANIGYLGHMWERYAMWAWLALFLEASYALSMAPAAAEFNARLAAFAAIGVGGAFGAVAGGRLADVFGRTALTMGAMALSGATALVMGFLFGGPPGLLFAVALFWGVTVIADSGQFSASLAELGPPERVGTMLTIQTCAGFLLTLATIHLIPHLVAALGWGPAFACLAIGPFLGVVAMARLRAHPEAAQLAGGRR